MKFKFGDIEEARKYVYWVLSLTPEEREELFKLDFDQGKEKVLEEVSRIFGGDPEEGTPGKE